MEKKKFESKILNDLEISELEFKPNCRVWNSRDELTGQPSEKVEAMFLQEWRSFRGLTFNCLYRNPIGCLIRGFF